jgi:hypothetical protein
LKIHSSYCETFDAMDVGKRVSSVRSRRSGFAPHAAARSLLVHS